MKLATTHITALLLTTILMMGCRGQQSENPPISPQQNMQFQDRFNAQETNSFFDNNMSMRMPVEGTIAQGQLRDDVNLYEGTDEDGNYIEENPMDETRSFLYRGKERYDIYCQPCHGGTGDGRGVIMTGQYGYVPAPTFHRDASYDMPDGEFYSAITNGVRNMPSYASQIPVEDRWAIVAYIRALQRSQNVPEDEMDNFDVDINQLQEEYQAQQAQAEAAAELLESDGEEDEEPTAELGEALYTQYVCNSCHSLDGSRILGPSFANLFGSERNFEDGSSQVADEDYLYESIVEPGANIVEDYDNVMQSYDYLSENELQSLIEFIKEQSDN
ncbi:MAG: c-type cytochrome [Balneolaceae bacterium]